MEKLKTDTIRRDEIRKISEVYDGYTYFEDGDDPTSELEWVFQVDKHRSFTEKLLGREKMTETDECLQYFKSIFENHNEFNNVTLE